MAINFMVQIAKFGLFTLFHSPGIPKQIAVSVFWF